MSNTILLIDDELKLCESLAVILTKNGYELTTANSGEEGLFHIQNNIYDAVIIDIGLPDIYGLELAAHASKTCPETAIIILTGTATVKNTVEALRYGVYDFLQKPCSSQQLTRTIKRGIEHKRLEKELKTSEKRFRQLSQATWEGIIIYSKGRVLQVNNQFCEMFGYEEQELVGKQIFDVLLDRKTFQTLQLSTNQERVAPFKARGRRRNGELFPVEIRIKHLDYKDERVQVAAIRDVTANELAMQQKMMLQEQLIDAKRLESLGLMASSVAHDLNNILAGIIAYPELLLLDLDDSCQYREEITMIRDAGKRAAAVVDDLLTVARGATCKKELLNLNTIISGYTVSAEYNTLCRRFPEVEIDVNLEEKLRSANCSALHISKSVMNLVLNAAESIQTKGRITITTSNVDLEEEYEGYEAIEPGKYVVISIEDSGSGISEKDIQKIFSPFYSKKIMGRSGTGLGLAVVWNTVHDHGGYIDLASKGEGTRFSLFFPAVTEERKQKNVVASENGTVQGNGETILVVDDQKSQRDIATRLLTRLGYQPFSVSSGEKAVEFIKKNQVDLVILDMLMEPGISGSETFRLILDHTPQQKAIITTGYSAEPELDQAKELGVNQFIKKPYSLQELGEALHLELNPFSQRP
ncbi:MAG: hypothetical protein CSB34_05715 [Desulfobulbus propionicus]|nr:MAG: hypothetical protein CSB34_05715 [Desulfobulbus propionicus]PIE66031.1 MAG: hypothetical protein CSA26_02015 [Desulfobacterales bacterium]